MPDLAETLSYGDISDMHRKLSETTPFFAGKTLPEFSDWANAVTKSNAFAQGLDDNVVKQASHAIDRMLKPVSDWSGEMGSKAVGSLFPGYEETGRQLGEGLPRSIPEMAAMATGPVGVGLGALDAAVKAYTDTGSKTAGLISGVSMGALPTFARKGGELAGEALSKVLPSTVGSTGMQALTRATTEAAGRNLGVLVNQELANQATSVALTGYPDAITPSHLAKLGITQLPFALLDIPGVFRQATHDVNTVNEAVSNYVKQGQPPRVSVGVDAPVVGAKGGAEFVPTGKVASKVVTADVDPWQQAIDEVLGTAVGAAKAKETYEARANTVHLVNSSETIAPNLHKLMDPALVEEYKKMGVLADAPDGSLTVLKKVPLSGMHVEENALESLPLFKQAPPVQKGMSIEGGTVPPAPEDQTESHLSYLLKSEQAKRAYDESMAKGGPAQIVGPIEQGVAGAAAPTLTAKPKPIEASANVLNTGDSTAKGAEMLRRQLVSLEQLIDPKTGMSVDKLSDVPIDLRLTKAARIRDYLEQTLREALTVRSAKGKELAKHPLFLDMFESFHNAMADLKAKQTTLPPIEWMNEVYNATMAHVAKLTRALEAVNNEAAARPEFGAAFTDLDKQVMSEGLQALEKQSYGQSALRGVADVLGGFVRFAKRLKGYPGAKTSPAEVGMIDDTSYYNILHRAGLLAQPEVFQKALDEHFRLNPDDKQAFAKGTASEKQRIIQQATKSFVLKLVSGMKPDDMTVELMRRLQAQDIAEREGFDIFSPSIEAMVEQADPLQEAKVQQAKGWLETTFSRPLTPEEWDSAGKRKVRIDVTGVETRFGGESKGYVTTPEQLAESRKHIDSRAKLLSYYDKFNKVLELVKSGDLVIDRGGSGYVIRTPKPESMQKVTDTFGMTDWPSIHKRVIDEVLPRMNAMYEQYARAQLKGMRVSAGVEVPGTVGDEEAYAIGKQATLPSDKLAMAAGARTWFRKFLTERGLDQHRVELYSDIATRVALAFEDTAFGKIGTITDAGFGGMYTRLQTKYGPSPYLVGLSKTTLIGNSDIVAPFMVTSLGHELMHSLFDPAYKPSLPTSQRVWVDSVERAFNSMSVQERQTNIKLLQDLVFPEKLRQDKEFNQVLEGRIEEVGNDAEEFAADYAGLMLLGVASPSKGVTVREMGEHLLLSGAYQQQFMRGLFLPLREVLGSLQGWFERTQPEFAPKLATVMEGVDHLIAQNEKIDGALQQLKWMEQHEPANFNNLVQQGYMAKPYNAQLLNQWADVNKAPMSLAPVQKGMSIGQSLEHAAEWMGLKESKEVTKEFGTPLNPFQKYLWTSAQLGQMFPPMRWALDIAHAFRPMANDLANKMLAPMMVTTKWLKRQVLDVEGTGMKYVLEHEEANKAYYEIVMREDAANSAFSEADMRAVMPHLSKEAQDHVIDYRENSRAVMENVKKYKVATLKDTSQSVASMLMLNDKSMAPSTAKDLGKRVSDATWLMMSELPLEQQAGLQALRTVPMAPDVLLKAQTLAENMQRPVKKFEIETRGNNWYMSEVRVGRYYAAYAKPDAVNPVDKTGLAAFDTKQEAIDWGQAQAKRLGFSADAIRYWDKFQRQDLRAGMNPAFLNMLKDIEQAALVHSVSKSGLDPQSTLSVLGYVPMEASLRDIRSGGDAQYFAEKKVRAGRETVDIAHGLLNHVTSLSNGLAKRWATAESSLALSDPKLKAEPAMLKWASDHLKTVLNPPTGEYSFLKRAAFSYYLGFNPSSLLVDLSTGVLSLAPQITQDTGNLAAGYKFYGKGVSDIVSMARDKAVWEQQNPMLAKALQSAQDRGLVDFGVHQEAHDADLIASLNLRSMMKGGEGLLTPLKMAGRGIDQFAMLSRWFYSYSSRFNSTVAFLSAYRAAAEHGVLQNGTLTKLAHPDAMVYAEHTLASTQHTGGQAARPGFFANLGNSHGIVGLMYSLGSYSMGTVSMMSRLGLQAIGTSKMSGAEKVAARKALGQMMMTQTALAGVMGLPMAAFAMTAVNQMFPELEPRKAVEDGLRQLFGEDQDSGGLITDMAMRGVPNAWLGFDLSSRAGLSSLMAVNGYDGLKMTDFAGPVGGIMGNMLKTMQAASTGQVGEAAKQFVPQAFKNILDLYQNDGVIRDKLGRPVVTPTANESAMYMMGFKPAALTALRDKQNMIAQHENVVKLQNEQFYREQATKLQQGDIAGVKQSLLDKERETNGLFQATQGAKMVAEEVLKQIEPFDLARNGSKLGAPERQRLASQLDRGPMWTEMQRLQTRKNLEAQMGVPGAAQVSPTELRKAQLVDQLMSANRLLSRTEAVQMADVMLNGHVPAQLR